MEHFRSWGIADEVRPPGLCRRTTRSARSRLVLVRPDQFAAWTGDTAPQDPAAALDRVVGRG